MIVDRRNFIAWICAVAGSPIVYRGAPVCTSMRVRFYAGRFHFIYTWRTP